MSTIKKTDTEFIRRTILTAAIQEYGEGAQLLKAIEELSELIRALTRYDRDNIAEEMADVRIMLDQLTLIFRNDREVCEWEFKKLKRLDSHLHAADTVG